MMTGPTRADMRRAAEDVRRLTAELLEFHGGEGGSQGRIGRRFRGPSLPSLWREEAAMASIWHYVHLARERPEAAHTMPLTAMLEATSELANRPAHKALARILDRRKHGLPIAANSNEDGTGVYPPIEKE